MDVFEPNYRIEVVIEVRYDREMVGLSKIIQEYLEAMSQRNDYVENPKFRLVRVKHIAVTRKEIEE